MSERRPPKILVFTRDDGLLSELRGILSDWGCPTAHAICREDALLRIQQARPDVGLFDVAESGNECADLTAAVKLADPNFPVLAAAGPDAADQLFELLKYPRLLALCKPFNKGMLGKSIKRILEFPPVSGNALRRSPRIPVRLSAEIDQGGKGTVTNLSLGGMFLETAESAEAGSKLKVHIGIDPAYSVTMDCSVVRIADGIGLALEFQEYTSEKRALIRALLLEEIRRTQTTAGVVGG